MDRIEVSINAQHVAELMAEPGPGNDMVLYRNFAALGEAWGLDAVNNDDESAYDLPSAVALARMLGEAGYKYTIAPYTLPDFWASLVAQANEGLGGDGLLDRVYLQCYDGGHYNDPAGW